jgi:hypothetical protein
MEKRILVLILAFMSLCSAAAQTLKVMTYNIRLDVETDGDIIAFNISTFTLVYRSCNMGLKVVL